MRRIAYFLGDGKVRAAVKKGEPVIFVALRDHACNVALEAIRVFGWRARIGPLHGGRRDVLIEPRGKRRKA